MGVGVSSFVDEEGVPVTVKRAKPGKDCASTDVFAFCLVVTAGFQLRNAVQTLHGFPSGPITIPGGILSPGLDPSGDEDGPAAIVICGFVRRVNQCELGTYQTKVVTNAVPEGDW